MAFVPVFLVVVSVVTPGCGLPIAPARHKVIQGAKIASATIQWIQTNKTTRAEIVSRLGNPSLSYPQDRVIAYSWQTRVGWRIGGQMTRWDTLLIQLNADQTVRKYEIRKIPDSQLFPSFIHNWTLLPEPDRK
jgi:hypothetical protein